MLNKILYILSPKHKKSLIFLAFLIFIGMLFELFGLGLIIPIISLLSKPESIYNISFLKPILFFLGNPVKNNIVIIGFLFLIFFYLIKSLFLTYLNWEQSKFSANFTAYVSQKLYYGYLRMPYSEHLDKNSAILIRNIQNEVSIFTSLSQSIIFLSTEITVILGVIALLISLEPTGALMISILLGACIFLFYKLSKKKITIWGNERQLYSGVISQNLMQGLGGIKDIKLINKELYFLKQYEKSNSKISNITARINTAEQLPRLYLEFIAIAAISGLIISMVLRGRQIDSIIPILGIFVASAFRMIPSINKIMYSSQRVVFSLPVINLLYQEFKNFSIFNTYIETQNVIHFNKSVHIRDLNFRYATGKKNALTNINLYFKKGESIGIVGESGSGKSTLVDILLGLLEPSSGDIIVDDTILCQNNFDSWHNTVAYVPQTIYLTDDTLKNNIALGEMDEEINEVNLKNAIKDAQLFNFINTLPEGINTKVGERGVRLSGGQRQRIGIARALYRNAEILVFDEATSALDNETEQSVMSAIDNLNGIKTLIIIAHRLTTVSNCTKIIEIKDGLIIKEG